MPAAQAATITVTGTADGPIANLAGNGTCDLREAIVAAVTKSPTGTCSAGDNNNDTIAFNLPGAGPHDIVIDASTGPLPEISGNVSINGYSQNGSSANTASLGSPGTNANIQIRLHPSASNVAHGLSYFNGYGVVKGLQITGFANGILVTSDPGLNNILWIIGNFIGTDGTSVLGNTVGVNIQGARVRVGFPLPQDLNLIAGNSPEILVLGANATDIVLSGNLFGTDKSGEAPLHAAGGTAISIAGGGTGPSNVSLVNNVISAGSYGVDIRNYASEITINQNRIGVGLLGADLGGAVDGIRIRDQTGITASTTIGNPAGSGGNTISNWGRDGIRIEQASAVGIPSSIRIAQNSIYGNDGLGINLLSSINNVNTGPDVNDPGDADTGPNGFQNYPVISSASGDGMTLQVSWSINTAANRQVTLYFYRSAACNNSGYGEGGDFRFKRTVTTDAAGNYAADETIHAGVAAGDVLTANATDDVTGNTSEFSACAVVTALPGMPPIFLSVDDHTGTVGASYFQDLAGWGYVIPTNGDPILSYNLVAGSLPPGVTLNTATGVISGTPTTAGMYNVTLAATDKDGVSNAQSFSTIIDTAAANSPPLMGDVPDQTLVIGVPFNLAIAGYVTLTDGDPVNFYKFNPFYSLPPGLNFDTSTGIISGTPNTLGNWEFEVSAQDKDGAGNADLINFHVIVAPNQPPIAVNDNYAVQSGQQLVVAAPGLLANDSDPESAPLTVGWGTSPAHGTFQGSPNGSFTYTPDPGYVGPDSFLYTAFDGALQSNVATVSITITAMPPAGVPPVMGNVPDQVGTVGGAFSLGLEAFVTITDEDPISAYAIASGALPPGLTLDAGTGVISGIPTSAGIYNVTIIASDKDGPGNADAIQFTITEAPTVLVVCQLNAQVYSIGGSATSVELSKLFSAPVGETLTYSASGLPAAWLLNSSTGLLSIVLSPGMISPSTYTSSLMATTSGGLSASQLATFQVLAANELVYRNGFDLSQNNCP